MKGLLNEFGFGLIHFKVPLSLNSKGLFISSVIFIKLHLLHKIKL